MKIKNGKSVTYNLLSRFGKVVYTGITNNPRKRFWEHKRSGKRFTRLQVTSRAISRWKAGYKEAGDLLKHRKKYGKRPWYNKTWNGKYNRRKRKGWL